MPSSRLSVRSRYITDKVTPKIRSRIMSHIRSESMAPEMLLRQLVYAMGYRYRLHRIDLPGKPDLVFQGRKKIIFVHGCFWHQHAECKDGHLPKTNLQYWIPKLERNIQRDKKVVEELTEIGWDVLVIWECQLADRERLAIKLKEFLSANSRYKSLRLTERSSVL